MDPLIKVSHGNLRGTPDRIAVTDKLICTQNPPVTGRMTGLATNGGVAENTNPPWPLHLSLTTAQYAKQISP